MTESEAEYLVAVDDMLSMDPTTMLAQAAEVRVPERVDPWLERRMHTFGASEALTLLIALGWEQPDASTPAYMIKAAAKLFAVKAGLRKPDKPGQAAELGSEAERPLVEQWNADPFSGWPETVHADAIPREFLPLIDRRQPRLSWTPDGWCRLRGALVPVEVKTDQRGGRTAPARHWIWQVQQAMGTCDAACALILYGPGWASWRGHDGGEIVPWVVERDETMIARLREAAAAGWERVEQMRKEKSK